MNKFVVWGRGEKRKGEYLIFECQIQRRKIHVKFKICATVGIDQLCFLSNICFHF